MKTTILLLFLTLSFQLLWAQAEKSFPYLTWNDANAVERDGSRFGYEPASFTPIFKPCRALPKIDPCFEAYEYDDKILLGRYKNKTMTEHVNVLYSPGPSGDPVFFITDKNNNFIWRGAADEMCINSNGVIYTSGNSNRMFNQRIKFKFGNEKVTEIPQPFYYVDVKGKLLKPVKLYSEKRNQGELVATLPVGYEIEILLAEPEIDMGKPMMNYLARTAFGLVGWLRLTQDDTYYMNPIVQGLGFLGD
ncbi:MAG TPA: hypothetical protein PKW37_05275 [Salinivirgaceae bacterium]|nr:hypothetical protein [Salinivirgaceae bacterium]